MNKICQIVLFVVLTNVVIVQSLDQRCVDRPRDIILVLDSSDSISATEYENAKRGISKLVSYFPISINQTRVGLINFGHNPKVEFEFDKYSDKAALNFAIRMVKQLGGGTAIGLALKLANNDLLPKMRSGVDKVIIVFSDGENTAFPQPMMIIPSLRDQKVNMFAIGIGERLNIKTLQDIASPNVVIQFISFQEMEKQINVIASAICPNIELVTQLDTTVAIRTASAAEKIQTTYNAKTTPFEVFTSLNPRTTNYVMSNRQTQTVSIETMSLPMTQTSNQNCIDRPRDIIIILDSSDSISETEYENAKKGISKFLSYFPISPTQTRVALINFGHNPKVEFDLDKYTDKATLNFAVRLVKKLGGGTAIGLALKSANTEIVPKMRANVDKILILFSDGVNTAFPPPMLVTPSIKAQNVSIYSIGIGEKLNMKELQDISSSNSVIKFASFQEMEKQAYVIDDAICPNIATSSSVFSTASTDKKSTPSILTSVRPKTTDFIIESTYSPAITADKKPRTTIRSRDESTVEPEIICTSSRIDLMFAFDSSSSLSEDHWGQELHLGTKIVDDLKIGKKFSQVGMLSFSSRSVVNINLGSIQDKEEIKKEMRKQELMEGSTYMAEALIACKDELMEKGRPDVKKTIVLVTDGAANSPKLLVEVEAEKIKKLGIKIIVVGLGFSILKKQLLNISSSEMYYPIEDMNKIALFDTSQLVQEACYIPKPIRICSIQQDIIIILDTSSQLTNTEHLQQLLFAKQFVDLLELSDNQTRIALITFADEADIIIPFTSNYNDLFAVLKSVKYRGGLTRSDKALAAAKKTFYLRPTDGGVKKLVVLLTNGLSKEPTKSIGESYDLQESGIDIMTVGVSLKANKEELRLIASPGMYLHRSEVKLDETLVQDAAKAACNTMKTISKTICESSGDVTFIIDKSTDLKEDIWQGMKSTLLATLRTLNVSEGLNRVAVIGYSDHAKVEFRLDDNFNSRDIYVAIKQLKQNGIGGKLQDALVKARQMFRSNNRNNIAKVVVILADKLPDNQRDVLAVADDLKNDGVKILTVGLSKNAPTSFFEELSSKKSQIPINDINKVMKHKEELRILLCDALTNKPDQCTMKVLDLIITMDSSSSIGPDNWKIQLAFINRVVGNLDLRKGRTRLGIFTFGSYVELRIPLNSSLNNEEMQKEIQRIPFVEGMTAIGRAIQDGTLHFHDIGRPNTPQVLVVLTDGSNTKGISPQVTAVSAKKAGIKIITVGIGAEISEKELKDISSSGNYYNVLDFQDLEKFNAKSITNDACQIPEKPKICDAAGDLIFIMGSCADKGTLRWNKMSEFMKRLTNLTVVGKDNTRVAVLKFNKGAYIDSGFKDNYAEFEQSIETMTSSVDGVFVGKALERARILFASDDRNNATKSVILISDSLISDRNITFHEAELIKRAGIKIFVIGVTQNISQADLGQVASKGKALFVNDFNNLNNFNALISSELCEVIKGASKECSNKQLEVMIAMDSSSSIGPDHWQTQLTFVEKIIKDMDISQAMTRVGLITFNTNSKKQFGLSEYSDKYTLISAIKRITFSEGLTAIGDAIRDCKLELMNNSRRGAPQLIILITDGESKGGIPPEEESILIKKYGIKIITIGIGDSISQSQLKFLSSTSQVYSVLDYTSLQQYDSSFITRETCLAGKVM